MGCNGDALMQLASSSCGGVHAVDGDDDEDEEDGLG